MSGWAVKMRSPGKVNTCQHRKSISSTNKIHINKPVFIYCFFKENKHLPLVIEQLVTKNKFQKEWLYLLCPGQETIITYTPLFGL